MSARCRILAVLAASRLVGLAVATAQPLPLGPEFQVNVVTTGAQSTAGIASADSGDFVIVWSDDQVDLLGDTSARLYDRDGIPASAPFVVAAGAGAQEPNGVASDALGNFVVTWVGGDANGLGVFARRYDAAGTPLGGAFQVNTFTTGSQVYPAVAVGSDGRFLVVRESVPQDGDGQGVYAQRYDASGVPDGAEVQIRTATAPRSGVTR